ncbi:flagellar hook-length control protein FliK [Aeromonas sp. sif0611]|uniref:flagellar hook-length control protein FliK n=1 Tax=Aeromonas sp. sif0611 TaxID=2854787 RepID=UPI001C4511A0|nr:flagellar hook-length control protein FliK [Aeromonas sp. sif0611]MBV7469524.1 flagellar hook-length control protein FliK [Aeromonas sp. sif0611]
MIQTQLIKAATQATPADSGITLPGLTQEGTEPLQGDSKAAFADAMALAQLVDKGAVATPVSDDALTALAPDAKSLAVAEEATSSTQHKADKAKASETDLPPDDFLQQLQASLRQDTSLTLPAAAPVTQALPVATDGNDLPPESPSLTDGGKPAPTPGAAGREIATQQALLQQAGEGNCTQVSALANKESSTNEPGKGAQAIAATANALSINRLEDAASANALPINQLEDVAVDAGTPVDPEPASSKPTVLPLSGEERAALLAKVVATSQTTEPRIAAAQVTGEPQKQMASEAAVNGVGAQTPHAVQAGAAKALGEGLVRMDAGVTDGVEASTDAATEDGSKPRMAAPEQPEQESSPAQTTGVSKPDASTGAAHSAAPLARAADPEPVLTAPQQTLARHESQGPQASLTALSAGIQQMEAEPTVAVGVAATLRPPSQKPKLDELSKQLGMEVGGTEPSEGSQPLQQTQTSDGKPAAEVSARREPQSLPHLKLATPEAPAQLHQKVNLMLADKLQQAEIQLDPLGLGKMKIQIQMGADSQANVHFVVQHGQTREMLEQAMPRLRDMLAGQGIQLGQTQVQQQAQHQGQPSQQQSQGQSTFNGQEQRGQQGNGSFGGNGQGEGEHATRTLSLLVESTNDAGIDFYA